MDDSTTPPTWKCQDPCLSRNKDNSVCGETGHFTSFAILVDGINGNKGCLSTSDNIDELVSYLSLAAVGVAIIFIFIGVTLVELYRQILKCRLNDDMLVYERTIKRVSRN